MLGDEVPHPLGLVEVHTIDNLFQLIEVATQTEQLEVYFLALAPHIEAMIGNHP